MQLKLRGKMHEDDERCDDVGPPQVKVGMGIRNSWGVVMVEN